MRILERHIHIHTKYEVSILNPVARRAVHRCQRCRHRCRCQMMLMLMLDDNYARQTNHDYIGSFGRIPNEPKTSTPREGPHNRCKNRKPENPTGNWSWKSLQVSIRFLFEVQWADKELSSLKFTNCFFLSREAVGQYYERSKIGQNAGIFSGPASQPLGL